MSRFTEKFGQSVVKDKRMEELKGLLLGWQMRAEAAVSLNLTEKEKGVLQAAEGAVCQAITALGSLKNG